MLFLLSRPVLSFPKCFLCCRAKKLDLHWRAIKHERTFSSEIPRVRNKKKNTFFKVGHFFAFIHLPFLFLSLTLLTASIAFISTLPIVPFLSLFLSHFPLSSSQSSLRITCERGREKKKERGFSPFEFITSLSFCTINPRKCSGFHLHIVVYSLL